MSVGFWLCLAWSIFWLGVGAGQAGGAERCVAVVKHPNGWRRCTYPATVGAVCGRHVRRRRVFADPETTP